jgi:hypothetical protein
MKTLTFGFLTLCIVSTLCVSSQDYKLVAPLPPRAVEGDIFQLPSGTTRGDAGFSRAFHSPLAVDQVVAFYNKETGRMEEVEQGLYRSHLVKLKILKPDFLHVYAVPREPGVTVRSIRTVSRRAGCSSEFFSHFRRMTDALDNYSKNDFRDLCEQYGYLDFAWFGMSDAHDAQGNRLTRDKVLYREYLTRLEYAEGDIMTAEDLIEEGKKLMAQGKMEEARKLFEKAAGIQMQAMQPMIEQSAAIMQGQPLNNAVDDHWDEWLQFLKDLDAMAYPTIVIIDLHPSSWTQDKWIKESIEW